VGLHVRLRSFPVSLYDAAEAQWKGLLREYVLRSFGGAAQAYGPDEVGRAGLALDVLTAAVPSTDPDPSSLPVAHQADVEVHSSAVTAGDYAMLQGVLEDAARLSRAGELLILAPLPEVVALRNWFCDQAVGQAAGATAVPWQLRGAGPEPVPPPVAWDHSIEPGPDVCWLVGDDHNTIVAASPAASALLGWPEGKLVGQRLLAVIPPAYREAHLAGFTRAVVAGGGRLLGRPVDLPALRDDGSEVLVTLTLTRHAAKAGRAIYLGVLEPHPVR
jgi:PAS domain S-box-containing protein